MAVLITHGYLLTGTGSNLYVNNLVRELVRKGQDVVLVCQDFEPMAIDFVDELYDFNSSNDQYDLSGKKETPFEGKCSCFRPNLNGFLPVYVYDHYEGFVVKEFNDCSDEEVARYVDQNVSAMSLILQDFNVEVVNTNHLVMFPYIAKNLKEQFSFKFVITVHGSALNFTVKKDKRFEDFAVESLDAVDDIVVDSLHADEEMKEFLEEVDREHLIQKMEIIPAGVDVSSFGIAAKSKVEQFIAFEGTIRDTCKSSNGRSEALTASMLKGQYSAATVEEHVKQVRAGYDYRMIDQDLLVKIDALDKDAKNVFFVGKYLWTKGIYLILLALPRILKSHQATNLIIAGFGPFREPAEVILNRLAVGDIEGLKAMLEETQLFKGEESSQIPLIKDIIDKHGEEIRQLVLDTDIDIRDRVVFTGILNHKQLVEILPAMDVLIAPSVFPEAFGMVAIEAAACGVYPVVTYQSAFKEIADHVKELLDGRVEVADVLLDHDASQHIAENVLSFFEFYEQSSDEQRSVLKKDLRDLVVQNFSWEGIARKYMQTFGL